MTSTEQTMRRLAVELQILEGTAEALQSRVNFVNAALTELRIAEATLGSLEKERENVSLFVPIGGGSYIKGKLESAEKVIVGMGAGVAIEKTMKEGIETLKKRTDELEKTRMNLMQRLTQVVENIRDGRSKLQDFMTKTDVEEKSKPV